MMVCKICSHPDRKAIDQALVDQRSLREIAGHYETSRSSLDRHKKHITKALTTAKQAETVAETTSLLSRIEKQIVRCESLLDKAERDGKWSGAAAAAKVIHNYLELLGKLNGELPNGARVAINFGDITQIDIRALTNEQLEALSERIDAETRSDIAGMSDAEIDGELAAVALRALPGGNFVDHRKAYLFDEETVPYPGVGDPTWHQRNFENMRACAIQNGWKPREWAPDRKASAEARLRLLGAAWKRLTGQELDLTADLDTFGTAASIAIEFDFADNNDWMAWPMVRLNYQKQPVEPKVQILPPVSRKR